MNKFFNIQFFAETEMGGADVSASVSQDATDISNVGAVEDTQTGVSLEQATASPQEADRLPFESILKQYGDDIKKYTQGIVEKRVHKMKGDSEYRRQIQPLIERQAAKYGVDPKDTDALLAAFNNDNEYYEELAMKNGTTPEFEKKFADTQRNLEEANAIIQARKEEEEKAVIFSKLQAQENEVKANYPEFNLQQEMQNPRFAELASQQGMSMIDAYRVIHWDEINNRTVQQTAQTVERGVVNDIRSGNRPTENGVKQGASATFKQDVSSLSRDQINKIMEDARRGKRITFK